MRLGDFKKGPKILPMKPKHLDDVLNIIDQHDEDDAEAAYISYEREGLDNQYVLCMGSDVVGMSGYRPAANTHATAWLSWTYLAESIQGMGHGETFVTDVIQKCKDAKFRKIFVSTSDYVDDEDGDIYARARAFYKSIGFTHQLTLPDYFDAGEAKWIYSIDFNQSFQAPQPSWSATSGFKCVDTFELLESDDTYTLGFDLNDDGEFSTADEIKQFIDQARSKGAKRLYVGLPSDAVMITRQLTDLGFDNVGRLKDYYRTGVSEVNFKMVL